MTKDPRVPSCSSWVYLGIYLKVWMFNLRLDGPDYRSSVWRVGVVVRDETNSKTATSVWSIGWETQ